jgi:hypothetical protein
MRERLVADIVDRPGLSSTELKLRVQLPVSYSLSAHL